MAAPNQTARQPGRGFAAAPPAMPPAAGNSESLSRTPAQYCCVRDPRCPAPRADGGDHRPKRRDPRKARAGPGCSGPAAGSGPPGRSRVSSVNLLRDAPTINRQPDPAARWSSLARCRPLTDGRIVRGGLAEPSLDPQLGGSVRLRCRLVHPGAAPLSVSGTSSHGSGSAAGGKLRGASDQRSPRRRLLVQLR